MRTTFIFLSIVLSISLGIAAYYTTWLVWFYLLIGPPFVLGWYDIFQKRHALLRNFPVIGHGRYWMESLRPKINQYFIESDLDGRPFSRILRNIVYQRAKQALDTNPFGTQFDLYAEGYEWMNHSLAAKHRDTLEADPRVVIGGPQCKKPYSASLLNISAMSFGSLSNRAVRALNRGALQGGFYHNTGEGGLSHYHLQEGGDIVWQIGTGYFGCRDKEGNFNEALFQEGACKEQVKMIEIKLSQGAKPGHGGILPARKNTEEIAAIRKVKPFEDVISPPAHSTFDSPKGLLQFVQKLRDLSQGKPVGFKLCVGRKEEFLSICKAVVETGIYPDFITVDGGEGGTGAAPLEFSNSVGMPLREGLAFAHDALVGFGIRKEIKLIASGKVITGFHLFRTLALGADLCNSARGMLLSLGCIQALECNKNTCPTGITTQNPSLVAGLDINSKAGRVACFQAETIESLMELIAAAGLNGPNDIKRSHVYRRVSFNRTERYDNLYPYIKSSAMLNEKFSGELAPLLKHLDTAHF